MRCNTPQNFSFVLMLVLFVAPSLHALPFNDDMVHDQYKVSEIMRDAPVGSVPVGSLGRYVKDREAAKTLKNPVAMDQASVERGKRLWATNCTPCHGRYTGKAHPEFTSTAVFEKPIDPVVAGATSGPTLVSKAYIEDPTKSDGHIFGYIYFGGLAIMPRYGYKLSPLDHWDIVNYVRYIQDDFRKVIGMESAQKAEDTDEDSEDEKE